jgi:eukaryotic-like serine/threonine-protein kinase
VDPPYNPRDLALSPGTRLGAYEVIALIGEGGMGQVYRARDTRLHRDVALKVLPDAFAADADRLVRFSREARTLASLNHPAIAQVHGLEESGDVRALVMELVEGDDLSQRIARGRIPLDDAVPIARQIAEALEAAHDQGIVHRDLKPANIKVRPDGAVKVLDFGLAKAMAPEPGGAPTMHASQPPTITSPALVTGRGVILGTAAYMAPEQAKGREADKRSDIWAFGCVLFEMLTGRRAFDGEDMADALGAVVRLEPDWTLLPLDVPPPLRTLLRRCLVKDGRQRIGDIAAARFVLEHQSNAASAPPASVGSSRVAWVAAILASMAAIVIGITALRGAGGGTVAREVVEFTIAPPENTLFGGPPSGGTGLAAQVAIAPDGRSIAFVAGAKSEFRIWLRPVASGTARPIRGTEGGTFPFWSPDSRHIAFFADGRLKRVAIDGGPSIVLADAVSGRGGSWSRDNVIVFNRAAGSGLFRVPAAGGEPALVTMLAEGEDAHRWPHFLPDGQHFLYTGVTGACCPAPTPGTIKIGSLADAGSVVALLQADSAAMYAAGRLLFARDGSLMAQAFDPATRQLVGDAAPVLERVGSEGSRYVSASVSEPGTLVYAAGDGSMPNQLRWFDRAGVPGGSLGEAGIDANLALSPDERQVALALRTGSPANLDIWTIDIARGLRSRVTSDPQPERSPVWSPDGTRLVFAGPSAGGDGSAARSSRPPPGLRPAETPALVHTAANGSAPKEVILEAEGTPLRPCRPLQCGLTATDWSSDGRFILYTFSGSFPATSDIWALPLFGDRKPFPVAHSTFTESLGRLSPDGRWIAYMTDETGAPNIYVQPFRRAGGKYRISPNGGRNPHWRADGKELFYLDGDGAMTVVPIAAGDTFEAGVPTTLFGTAVLGLQQVYAVTRDGQRFLINARPQSAITAAPLTVIVNWTSTLQQ